jgi:hypothetical protein
MQREGIGSRLEDRLLADDLVRVARYPGPMPGRQPVHTVYLAPQDFHAGVVGEWGVTAITSLEEYGPLPGFDSVVHTDLEQQVHDKLQAEPIEDLRIDFAHGAGTAGLGVRGREADRLVAAAARSVAESIGERTAPLAIGIRIPSLVADTRYRAIRTLDVFLDTLLAGGSEPTLPDGFRITVSNVVSVVQVAGLVEVCEVLEAHFALPTGRLTFEIEVASPQAVLGPDGASVAARMLHSAGGRCRSVVFAATRYAAALEIIRPEDEALVTDHARSVLQVACAGTGIHLSDGAVTGLPVGGMGEVRRAWTEHAGLVTRSLRRGFYQGVDRHPAQLPTRFAATFAFYSDGAATAATRLQHYLDGSAAGTMEGLPTAHALAGYLIRGLDCGAVTEETIAQYADVDRVTLDHLTRGT